MQIIHSDIFLTLFPAAFRGSLDDNNVEKKKSKKLMKMVQIFQAWSEIHTPPVLNFRDWHAPLTTWSFLHQVFVKERDDVVGSFNPYSLLGPAG